MKALPFRQILINQLQRRADSCAYALKQLYRHDLVEIWSNLQKDIEIQQSYLQHEGE